MLVWASSQMCGTQPQPQWETAGHHHCSSPEEAREDPGSAAHLENVMFSFLNLIIFVQYNDGHLYPFSCKLSHFIYLND